MKVIKTILLVVFFILVLLSLSLFAIDRFFTSDYYKDIYLPSKISLDFGCGKITEEELNQTGAFVVGFFNASDQTITLIRDTPETRKHEHCHDIQFQEDRRFGCNREFKRLLNEIECEKSERLSDLEYIERYGNYNSSTFN